MATRQFGAVLRQVDRLFGRGTVAGMTEGELLDRFARRGDEAAFEAIVARHGPMVWGVCRRLLDDPNDVDDAFQATFLVLVQKAGRLRDPERLANWLYGVAHRVAARARARSARRRVREAEGPEMIAVADPEPDDLGPILHEEVRRLPEKYRAPVVLCFLEGRTHEEAAALLRWPIGTVKGRLARAKEQLRSRLTRRGLAVPAGLVAAALARDARAAVPPPLVQSTLRAALAVAAGRSLAVGVVPATTAALTQGVLRSMFLTKLKIAATAVVAAGLLGGAGASAYQLGGAGLPGGGAVESKKNAVAPRAKAPAKEAGQDEPDPETQLAEAKANLARIKSEIARANFRRAKEGMDKQNAGLGVDLKKNDLYLDSMRLVTFEKEVGLPAAERIADLEQHVQIARNRLESRRQAAKELKLTDELEVNIAKVDLAQAELMLAEARAEAAKADRPAQPAAEGRPAVSEVGQDPKSRLILDALDQPISMPFLEPTPLEDVIRYIKSATIQPELPDGIPIYLDPVAVAEARRQRGGVPGGKPDADLTVSMIMEGVALKTTLRLLLSQVGLAYNVKEGLLIIATPDSPELYPNSVTGQKLPPGMGMGGMGGGGFR